MKNYKKTLFITTVLMLLPMIIGLLLWNRLPERMPTHWNGAGEVDGWSSRAMAVFGIPGMLLGAHLLCALATLADPKRENVGGKVLKLVLWILPVMSLAVNSGVYAMALGWGTESTMPMLVLVLVGLLFIGIGNYLPKCKQNYTVGIKLPWTLNSEENWNRTHRMAGWLWIAAGIIMVVCAFVRVEAAVWVTLGVLAAAAFIPMVYSFLLYKKGI